ncbi:uncharacterized protein LOC103515598 [Diaphorina citri]|uniref:Uncharacterized protein LOC103515598 n=1 Tax=Diaphorina citri TaxID=121845 RepID=A0A1S4EJ95_DIACI|nr:uncharacterized protein LOC103515598 [Diaphorina citri]
MDISVSEHVLDTETLMLSNITSDDDVEEATEAALSTVDSDFGRTKDPIKMYMREMGSVELLTRDGEIEIAKRIEEGLKDMIHAISSCPTTIMEILIAADKISKNEIKIDEIVDGLIDKNFSSNNRVIKDQARTIRIPVHMIETINKISRISRQILQETGSEPDPSVIAIKMEMPEEKIRKIMKIAKEPVSMESPVGDDEDSHLGDFIEDENMLAPSDAALNASMRSVVKDILNSLTPRESKVLRMRFGIEMSSDHTLEEVGDEIVQ